MMNGAVGYRDLLALRSGVPTDGSKNPFGSPNWLLWNCKSFSMTGSMSVGAIGKAAVLSALAMEAASRVVGREGKAGLLICVPGESALRWRVP